MANKITVLLADDHTLVRRGFRRLLEDDTAVTVVGEASDGDEAVKLAAALKPHVVVMDCAMPGTSGLIATKQILQRAPETAVLMLSMHSEATLVRQALDSGAAGTCSRMHSTSILQRRSKRWRRGRRCSIRN